jgi:hypothetical protein
MRLLTLSLLIACGNARSGGSQHPPREGRPDAGREVSGSATMSPSEQDCVALIAHALELALATRTMDQPLDDAERASVLAGLRQRFASRCRELPSATYRCFMAAATLDALHACDEHDQATFRSSTSNSSVAFGGITPPAPRSP